MADQANGPDSKGAVGGRRTTPVIHRTDFVICLIILTTALVLFYATTQFEAVADVLSQNIGPGLFPQILLVVIIALSLALPVEHLFLERGASRLDQDRSEPIRPLTLITMGLLIATVALMPLLGTVLTMVAVCIGLPTLWGERRLRVIVPFALLFPAGVTIVFSVILKVHFEPGLLGLLPD